MAERSRLPQHHGQHSGRNQGDSSADDFVKENPVGVLSHEIRSPLTAIQAAIEVLKEEPGLSENARQSVDIISRQATYISRITNDLGSESTGTFNPQTVDAAAIDLIELAGDILATVRPQFDARGQKLITNFAQHRVLVIGDRTRLHQAQVNLLNNASKFTQPGGTIQYEIQCNRMEALIVVRDNGTGIAGDQISAIFEPYNRGDNRFHNDGQGIGLALVKQIVDQHGGSIVVASGGYDRGSEFSMRLPLAGDERNNQPKV